MKLLPLLVLGIASAAAAAAIEEEESTQRDKRVFSLFSIVQFPNSACTSTSSTYSNGWGGVPRTLNQCISLNSNRFLK